jgi:hypothetical protein
MCDKQKNTIILKLRNSWGVKAESKFEQRQTSRSTERRFSLILNINIPAEEHHLFT